MCVAYNSSTGRSISHVEDLLVYGKHINHSVVSTCTAPLEMKEPHVTILQSMKTIGYSLKP